MVIRDNDRDKVQIFANGDIISMFVYELLLNASKYSDLLVLD